MFWPPNSPDLNPMEHIWDVMERQLRAQTPPCPNISTLRDRCLDIWCNLSPVMYQKLVASQANCSCFEGQRMRNALMKCSAKKRKFYEDYSYIELDSSSDGVLRTEDGGKFNINRNLLARQCPFFKALFCGNFGDSKGIILKGIEAATLDSILVYLYTGTTHLNKENTTDILVALDHLLIDPLLQESRSFVLREMTPINCVPLFQDAWRIERLNILNSCHRFIVVHFQELESQYEEIGNIPFKALKKILKEQSLNVSDERTVWNVIVRWMQFDFPDRW
ncbi:Actin-binding protein IPP [Araneus ventricosus]|uniref:Actin-binding protein IPP n=1 Tax=Araneus ventricosus TaxID=182803 RepID=A0A4Y2L427_ARAVE|nr:Actin-binding protein IPP [Araneus ventricosus]